MYLSKWASWVILFSVGFDNCDRVAVFVVGRQLVDRMNGIEGWWYETIVNDLCAELFPQRLFRLSKSHQPKTRTDSVFASIFWDVDRLDRLESIHLHLRDEFTLGEFFPLAIPFFWNAENASLNFHWLSAVWNSSGNAGNAFRAWNLALLVRSFLFVWPFSSTSPSSRPSCETSTQRTNHQPSFWSSFTNLLLRWISQQYQRRNTRWTHKPKQLLGSLLHHEIHYSCCSHLRRCSFDRGFCSTVVHKVCTFLLQSFSVDESSFLCEYFLPPSTKLFVMG